MKILIQSIISIIFIIFTMSCSGGKPLLSIAVNDPGDFNGVYVLRDENCINKIIKKFSVAQETDIDAIVTILEPNGVEGVVKGDIFAADIYEVSGTPVIDAPDLLCAGSLMKNSTDADDTANLFAIDVFTGDGVIVCSDIGSADGLCELSYARIE